MNYQIRFTESKNLINCPTYAIAWEMWVHYNAEKIKCFIVEMEV